MTKTVYLDNAATTKVDKEVVSSMDKYHLEEYGNASSNHHKGAEAKKALEKARKTIAESIGAEPDEIIFTSGGTESNNLAVKEIAFANMSKHIIISRIEHDCILNTAKFLEKMGFKITYLDVDKEGLVNPDDLEKAIIKDTILVSIIHANNEIGTIQDIKKLGEICRKKKVLFHTDACQSFTKTELDINRQNLDLVTLNAHKIHGPKGVGALYIRKGIKMNPFFHGGGHEKGIRSGTENIPGIVGFAESARIGIRDMKTNKEKMSKLRDYLIEGLLKIDGTSLNGATGESRLCNNINVSFRYIEGESIIAGLDEYGICASTGSACSSHTLDPSHVMMALEDNAERAHGSIRFSLSKYSTKDEIDFTLEKIKKVVEKLRRISPLNGD
ncbi:MAG: cysteine desulfurase family protein [Candidatus Woesearchaeota archaeon]